MAAKVGEKVPVKEVSVTLKKYIYQLFEIV